MGPQLDAGQFLRPLDAPRPADRGDIAGTVSTTRSEPGGERFQTLLDDARTAKAPRKAEASGRGASGREPAPVGRKKNGDSPDAAASQASPDGPPVAPAPTESEGPSPDTDGAAVGSSEAAAPDDTQCHALPPQPPMKPPNPVLPLVQETIVDVVTLPPATEISEQVDVKVPEPADSALPTPSKEPLPANDTRPIGLPPPVVDIAGSQKTEEGESASISTGATPTRERPADSPIANSTSVGLEDPTVKELEVATVKAEPHLHPAQRPVGRPAQKPDSEIPVKKVREAPVVKGSLRADAGSLEPADPMTSKPRPKEVSQVDSEEPLVEVHRSVRHRPISVRSGIRRFGRGGGFGRGFRRRDRHADL